MSESAQSKRGRGPATGISTWGTGERFHLTFDAHMQPNGLNASSQGLLQRIGIMCHLHMLSGQMQEDVLERCASKYNLNYYTYVALFCSYMAILLQDNTNAPDEYRSVCLKIVGLLWKNWNHVINFYSKYENDVDRLANYPSRVDSDLWKVLVQRWSRENIKVYEIMHGVFSCLCILFGM